MFSRSNISYVDILFLDRIDNRIDNQRWNVGRVKVGNKKKKKYQTIQCVIYS